MVGYGAGHHFNSAHHQAHVAAKESFLAQRTALAADLREKEQMEASAVEKQVADDEQTTATSHREERDSARLAAEAEHILARASDERHDERAHREADAEAIAEVSAQAAAAFHRADEALKRAQAARDAKFKNAEESRRPSHQGCTWG